MNKRGRGQNATPTPYLETEIQITILRRNTL